MTKASRQKCRMTGQRPSTLTAYDASDNGVLRLERTPLGAALSPGIDKLLPPLLALIPHSLAVVYGGSSVALYPRALIHGSVSLASGKSPDGEGIREA